MKAENPLLFVVNVTGGPSKVCASLRPILEPSFTVGVLQTRQKVAECINDVTTALDKRVQPVLIFIVFSPAMLEETRTLLASIREKNSHVPLIVVAETCEPTEVIELLNAGAADFITTPLQAPDVLPRVWRLVKQTPAANGAGKHSAGKELIGESACFLAQVMRIPLIARCDANVFISGETGTGKELYARAIHYSSARASRPFMPVNCGAIPVDLVENELFGHARGAFTNAFALQTGLVEEASGGTLFLDEIDCLPMLAQVKLLRFLQEKEYRPLGSAKVQRANVRIIAASNVDLEEAVKNGRMRQDLFYRLNIISLTLPPLRERREDIPLLTDHFLEKYANEFGKPKARLTAEALHVLMNHGWPGNVRELEHVIERSLALCEGAVITESDLALASSTKSKRPLESLQEAKAREIAQFEKNYIQNLLRACSGNITRAAHAAQKNRRAFWQLIQKHQIDVSRFKPGLSS